MEEEIFWNFGLRQKKQTLPKISKNYVMYYRNKNISVTGVIKKEIHGSIKSEIFFLWCKINAIQIKQHCGNFLEHFWKQTKILYFIGEYKSNK
ncbi:hypothetical protein IHO40_04455 [Wolbachia endosymbiont of Mansonella ozzardi]|uniref:hypothetical protein n=1 Tax=Wolbachia endosymbiont of Mansonella ozzardi TaxID=137464 RepID=UPI001CE07432|nr:hypothetical protein [Wolbachia endosymbiont of Mansonella ozzardi]MCA4775328.1 hypothetical protein [Wolbachia endosymbiont of Mansonella ozzardi]